MKKELAKFLAVYQGLDLSYHNVPGIPVINKVETSLDEVLKEIFAVDPRTGAPKGDIAYYLSPDGNPMIKQWLENNLLKPRGVTSSNGEYDDDIIAEYARGADETVDDYRSRIIGYLDSANSEIERIQSEQNS